MFLVKTKLVLNSVEISDFSSQYSWRKFKKKIHYLNYVRYGVGQMYNSYFDKFNIFEIVPEANGHLLTYLTYAFSLLCRA